MKDKPRPHRLQEICQPESEHRWYLMRIVLVLTWKCMSLTPRDYLELHMLWPCSQSHYSSCPSSGECYHILAAKFSMSLPCSKDENLTQVRRKARTKEEKSVEESSLHWCWWDCQEKDWEVTCMLKMVAKSIELNHPNNARLTFWKHSASTPLCFKFTPNL
jgi:hypothetical protein